MNVEVKSIKSFKNPYFRYGYNANNHDVMKCWAFLLMVIDHIGLYFFPEHEYFRSIGRASAPIWLFLIGYNYKATSKIYPLFAWALILELILLILGKESIRFSILMTMAISKLLLKYYHRYPNKVDFAKPWNWFTITFLVIILCLITNKLFEYGTLGVIITLWGYNCKNEIGNKLMQTITIFCCYCLIQALYFGFDLVNTLISVISIGIAFYYLYQYRLKHSSIHGPLKNLVIIISRYSLYLYISHIIIFQLITSY